jgi:uncharacterized membrane protein HdeD (DUF308 family)
MIVAGLSEVVNAFQIKSWGKCLLWALLGVFCCRFRDIRVRWPMNSVYVLRLFLGIDLILAGAGWIGIGLGLRGLQAWRGLTRPA